MKKRFSYLTLLLLTIISSLLFLPGCPYQSGTLSPRYWDESMKETNQDIDDAFGARDHK